VLLDTHTFLWYSSGDPKLGTHARLIIDDRGNELFLSAASLLEMAIKASLGRLALADPFEQFVTDGMARLRCQLLNLTVGDAAALSALPFHHRDPFDRILVAQAIVNSIDLVSVDTVLDLYGIRRHW
jgi:PIN domain nuclease of toxin-antitoxin system